MKRLTSDELKGVSTFSDDGETKFDQSEAIEALVRKGNERLGFSESHACCLCRKVLSNRFILKRHILSTHGVTPDKLSCFSTLVDHEQAKADQNEMTEALVTKGNEGLNFTKPHTCCFCQKVLKDRGKLKRHMLTLHSGSLKVFCDLCPKIYFSKSDLLNHMKNVHCEKRFACDVCDYKTANRNHIKKHKMIHNEKVQCPICKKLVTSLRGHVRMHTKVKCSICQKTMIKQSLRQHMANHVQKCKSCGETFEDKPTLRRQVWLIFG